MGSSSDDSNDNDYLCSNIKPDLVEAHKRSSLHDEEWPNKLPSEIETSTRKLPQPSIENILKMIRNRTHAKSTQNEIKENIGADDIAKICSIGMQELESIIGSVQRPKPAPPPSPPPPPRQPLSQPPPPPLLPQHLSAQPANMVSTVQNHS